MPRTEEHYIRGCRPGQEAERRCPEAWRSRRTGRCRGGELPLFPYLAHRSKRRRLRAGTTRWTCRPSPMAPRLACIISQVAVATGNARRANGTAFGIPRRLHPRSRLQQGHGARHDRLQGQEGPMPAARPDPPASPAPGPPNSSHDQNLAAPGPSSSSARLAKARSICEDTLQQGRTKEQRQRENRDAVVHTVGRAKDDGAGHPRHTWTAAGRPTTCCLRLVPGTM